MNQLRVYVVLFVILSALSVSAYAGDLLSYIKIPDTSYKWEKVSQIEESNQTRYILKMTSQTWQNITWTHDIEIVKPAKCDYPDTALLFITFGKVGDWESKAASIIASETGCPITILYGIPNQPLFDGKREDALIAHTFIKAMETGDDTWPLLFPMTKSAVRAMDAIQAFSRQDLKQEIKGFVVSGASKRGWTTWLTAAADPVRVKGIAPMVYDNLNLSRQMAHQVECWGKYSSMIDDYTNLGIQEALQTEKGKYLAGIVDPWSYRSRIKMPKLIINGTNDPYWTQDSLNIYWDDLIGTKHVLYVPNCGHDLSDPIRVLTALTAFTRTIASKSELPKLTWDSKLKEDGLLLTIKTDSASRSATVWTVKSDTQDFRKSKWEAMPTDPIDGGYQALVSLPKSGYLAVLGEVPIITAGRSCMLSTQVYILDSKGLITVSK
ncbi:MAG TPA: PhoPQ-activated protein PqaA family protein [Armatimonadota bacterium]|jgi:PhoPQ-activated pathogenicity-related protein|nr:PhoPQ-activated protein PqaA family protein [Armatimonadota bacterium]HPP74148.1 PhoPQ-activated protein PqaA family protein [Armatimonadota bacterium]